MKTLSLYAKQILVSSVFHIVKPTFGIEKEFQEI